MQPYCGHGWSTSAGGRTLVSTRKLILSAMLCGLAILLASAVQLFQIIS